MFFKRKPKPDDLLDDDVSDTQIEDAAEVKPSMLARFQNKQAKPAKGKAVKGGGGDSVEVIAHPEMPSKALAFGVRWRSVVSNKGRSEAIKFAKDEKATHYIFRGGQAAYGRIPADVTSDISVYPASLAAAKLHAGDCLYIIRIADGEYWVASTRNGTPTTLDRYIKNSVDVDALEIANIAFEQDPENRITVYTNLAYHNIENARTIQPHDLFDVPLADDARLAAIPKAESSIPKPVMAVVAVVVLGLTAQQAYKYWQQREAKRLAAMNAVVDEPPEVSWERAINEWQSKTAAPQSDGLNVARKSLDKLPATWSGWSMESATCNATDMLDQSGEMQRVWACGATYNRGQTGLLNREMEKVIPADYKATFIPLNKMSLSWQVVVPAKKIDITTFPSWQVHVIETASKFQHLEVALTQSPNIALVPLELPAPKKSDGTSVPPIDKVTGLKTGTLSIAGPLRSIDAVLANDINATWKTIQLTYTKDAKSAGLTTSALTAAITGDIYAKQ